MGCFAPSEPAPINYGQETTDTLNAQLKLAPQLFANEEQYDPMYGSLAMSNLQNILNGSSGGSTSVSSPTTASQTGWYTPEGNFVSPGMLAAGTNGAPMPKNGPGMVRTMPGPNEQPMRATYIPGTAPANGDMWENSGSTFNINKNVNTPATPGLNAILANANTAQRSSDIQDVQNLGSEATQAMLNANPQNAALLNLLNGQAQSELEAGSNLTPDEQTAMQQASRAAFAARGMAGSNTGIADELLKQFNLGQQLLQQRQGFAQSVIGSNQAVVGDPFMQIVGRPSGAVSQAQGIQGNAGPGLFNPQSSLAASIASGNQQMDAAFADPSTLSKINGVLGTTGSLVGGIASAIKI